MKHIYLELKAAVMKLAAQSLKMEEKKYPQ